MYGEHPCLTLLNHGARRRARSIAVISILHQAHIIPILQCSSQWKATQPSILHTSLHWVEINSIRTSHNDVLVVKEVTCYVTATTIHHLFPGGRGGLIDSNAYISTTTYCTHLGPSPFDSVLQTWEIFNCGKWEIYVVHIWVVATESDISSLIPGWVSTFFDLLERCWTVESISKKSHSALDIFHGDAGYNSQK